MTTTRTRFARAALTTAGLAVAGAFLLPGTASAAPADNPLLQTTCSFAQVDAAAHHVAPHLAQRLDAHPDRKAKVAQFFDKTPAERAEAAQQFLDKHPQAKQRIEDGKSHPRFGEFKDKARQIADTCHNY
ncbi:hemophore-related protein [Aldersonia sp. NBC_00410]|uniref:hemophore-related protein n=1 Tax=Aldersonia sp. NBC_00410 TaxID=2975954 RepID=UPI00225289EE|nr:hemophore-related protein [Aldersonia sp. NBC_00410]MCX5042235.1 hemophore-related protein [Aldersonia sp. NBC_00410]